MLIENAIIFSNGRFESGKIRIEKGIFKDISQELTQNKDEVVIDAEGMKVLPGLTEIHSHGCIGEDFSSSDEDGIRKMLEYYANQGILNILATTMTDLPENTDHAMSCIKAVAETQQDMDDNCRILGIHLEGPFLSHAKRGAHDERYLQQISEEMYTRWDKKSGHRIRLLAVDPDLEGAESFIRNHAKDITISLAHTECNYDTACRAFTWGASHVTHLLNAMNEMQHREPGILGAAADHGVFMEMIYDGVHIHPSVVRLINKAVSGQMVMISDSMCAAGMKDGQYVLGGQEVFVKNGKAALKNGTLAGSALNLYEMMRRAIQIGIPAEQAILSATYLPAKSIGIEGEAGSITKGHKADFLLVDADWNLKQVYKSGRRIR